MPRGTANVGTVGMNGLSIGLEALPPEGFQGGTGKCFPIGAKSNRNQIHFPTDLEPNGSPFAVPNQSENGKYNLISG